MDDIYKRPGEWDEPDLSPTSRTKFWFTATFVGVGLLLAMAGLLLRIDHQPNAIDAEALVGPNKVLLRDKPKGVAWLSFTREFSDLLGSPIQGVHAIGKWEECVTFEYFVICHLPDPSLENSDWQFVPLMLGYDYLPGGVSLQIDAASDPLVEQYKNVLRDEGRDWLLWLGRPIARPSCSDETCLQVFERQILTWARGEQDPRRIKLSPLGSASEGGVR
jgi:hypothetical protein